MMASIPYPDYGKGVEIFVSNPWDASASANIRNLHIGSASANIRNLHIGSASLPVSYYPKISGFNITSGNLVGVVALPAQYFLCFDLFLTANGTNLANIIHLTANGGDSGAGARLPAVFLSQNPARSLALYFWSSGSTAQESIQTARNLPINAWITIVISVDAINQLTTMTVSGAVSINAQSVYFTRPDNETWPSVQVYASDPWWPAAAAKIRNLAISSASSLPTSYYPATTYPSGFSLSQAKIVGMLALPAQYVISLRLFINADGTGMRNIFSLMPEYASLWLADPSNDLTPRSATLSLFVASKNLGYETLGSETFGSETFISTLASQALPLMQWCNVTIAIDNVNQLMNLTVTGGVTIPTVTMLLPSNSSASMLAALYLPWGMAPANAAISDLRIEASPAATITPTVLPASYYPFSTYPSGVQMVEANMLGFVALPSS
jgi:hypothetical protein